MLKTIQKRAELAALRQQHFLYQRKNLYIPILGRIFSGEPDSDDNHDSSSPLDFFIPASPYFIVGSDVRWGRWRQDQREAWARWGTHGNIK